MILSGRGLSKLEPQSHGYLVMEEPEDGWTEYFQPPSITPFRKFQFPRTAKSCVIGGTRNRPGAVGLGQTLKLAREAEPGTNRVVPERTRQAVISALEDRNSTPPHAFHKTTLAGVREPASASGPGDRCCSTSGREATRPVRGERLSRTTTDRHGEAR